MAVSPYPILLESSIGPVYTHGVFFATAALVGALFLVQQRRFFDRSVPWVLERAVWIFGAGLLAARLGFFLSYPSAWDSVGQAFSFWEGGLVSYWGMLGGAAVVLLLGLGFEKEVRPRWYSSVVLATLLAWGIGRFGNFFAGDSVGVQSSVWAMAYGRVPIQIFESILCLALFFSLLRRPPRIVLLGSGIGYFAGRFFIDIWRDESVFVGLHVSQCISFLALLTIFAYARKS